MDSEDGEIRDPSSNFIKTQHIHLCVNNLGEYKFKVANSKKDVLKKIFNTY